MKRAIVAIIALVAGLAVAAESAASEAGEFLVAKFAENLSDRLVAPAKVDGGRLTIDCPSDLELDRDYSIGPDEHAAQYIFDRAYEWRIYRLAGFASCFRLLRPIEGNLTSEQARLLRTATRTGFRRPLAPEGYRLKEKAVPLNPGEKNEYQNRSRVIIPAAPGPIGDPQSTPAPIPQ